MKQAIFITIFAAIILPGLQLAAKDRRSSIMADSELFGYWLSEDRTIVVEITSCSQESEALCGFIRAVPGIDNNIELSAHAAKLCNIPILSNLVFNPDQKRWDSGHIFDPETRQLYDVHIRTKGTKLIIRAFDKLEMLGETLIWTSVPFSNYGCS